MAVGWTSEAPSTTAASRTASADGAALIHPFDHAPQSTVASLGQAGPRWLARTPKPGRRFGTISGSAAAHVAVVVALLAIVRRPPPPAEPEQQVIEMVFEAPSAAPAAITRPDAPPAEAPPQSAVTPPSEPPPPPPEQAARTSPPEPLPQSAVTPPSERPPPQPEQAALPPPEPLPLPLPAPSPLATVTGPREPAKPAPRRPAPQRSRPAPETAFQPAPPRDSPAAPARQAAPTAAAPSAASPAREAAAAPVDGAWQQALGAWLAAHKTYPEQARRRGEEGRVAIRFTVNRSGRVLDVEVVRGSGSAVLDTAASTLLHGAALPPFAASMPQDQVTVTVQLRYSLAP